jgi:hypothetical protein
LVAHKLPVGGQTEGARLGEVCGGMPRCVLEDIIDGGATKEQTEYIEQTAQYKYKSLIYESD